MPPKSFQKVELSKPSKEPSADHSQRSSPTDQSRLDDDQKKASNFGTPQGGFGEQNISNCSIPYGGTSRIVNATVNSSELQAGIKKQKAAFAQSLQQHQEYRRVPKGQRIKRHKLPVEEDYAEDGDVILKRKTTATRRNEN